MTLVLSCITRQAVAETVENFRNSPRFHGGAKRLGTNTSEPRLLHPTSSRSQVRHGPRAEADNPTVLGIRYVLVRIRMRILGSTDPDADPGCPKTYGSGFGTQVHLHHSSKIKVKKNFQNNRNQGFFILILLDDGRIRIRTCD
jgi:hypothetical protein